MNLLELDVETKLPKLSGEALTISEFRVIWDRLHRVDGDRTGEKKMYNLQQIGYIYFKYNFASRFRYDNDKEDKIRELLKLAPDWEPEPIVEAAGKIYADMQYVDAQDTVDEMVETIKSIKQWLKIKRGEIALGRLTPKDISEIQGIIDDMPTTVENLNRAKKLLYDLQASNSAGRKGRALGKFERPTTVERRV